MDSESGVVKRKRGRPTATVQNETEEPQVSNRQRVEKLATTGAMKEAPRADDAESRKRKRGQPSNAEQPQNEQDASNSPRVSRKERINYGGKRRYNSGTQENDPQEHETQPDKEDTRGSRGKTRADYGEERRYWAGNQESGDNSQEMTKKTKQRPENESSKAPRESRVDYGEKRRYSSGNQKNGDSSQEASQRTKQRVDKGQSAPTQKEVQGLEAEPKDVGKKSRPGRPSKSSQVEPTEQENEQRKSDKASKRKQSKPGVIAEEEQERPAKKRGRPSLTGADQDAETEPQPGLEKSSKRRGRPSLNNDNQAEEAQPQPPKKRRGRPSNADSEATPAENPADKPPAKKTKSREENKRVEAGRKRKSKSQEDENQAEAEPERKKQRQSNHVTEVEEVEENEEIAHQRLVPREHKISRTTIDTKWNLLPPAAISQISTLLHNAERPVLHRFQTNGSRTLAQSALSAIISKVERSLRKGLPFPPASNNNSHGEEDFDLERIMRQNRALENQLTVLGHSNDLLVADQKREEAMLEAEKEVLKTLEESVKEERAFNKGELRKKEHALLKNPKIGDDDDEIALVDKTRVDLTKLQEDSNLAPIIKQIHGHLDSMQGNTEQIKGIGAAIVESRAAVENILFKHVDEMQYEKVVLS